MMKWDSKLYDERHDFVSGYGRSLADLVNTAPDQTIWDLGCGTGRLTDYLSRHGAHVIGTDLSADMIAQATENYPSIDFRIADAITVQLGIRIDTVFSNAVFHWILDQEALLSNVAAHLSKGGRLVGEMGAKGNIGLIEQAFASAMERHGIPCRSKFLFPSAGEYAEYLRKAGFDILSIEDFDRPTPFKGEEKGMRNWLVQFYATELQELSDEMRENILQETEADLRPRLLEGKTWTGDYRRLRFVAVRR